MEKYKLTDNDKEFLTLLKSRKNESEMMESIYSDAMLRVIGMLSEITVFKEEISIRKKEGEPTEALEKGIEEMKADLIWLKNLTGDDFVFEELQEA